MMRLSNSPTVISNALVGLALAGIFYPSTGIIPLIISQVLFYSVGMILNDICDFEFDKQHRPERPLVRGTISRRSAVIASVVGLIIAFIILFYYSNQAVIAGIILLGFILLYNFWHKGNPLSPVLMAACRVMVYMVAYLAFHSMLTLGLIYASLGLGLYIIGLTYYAKYTSKHYHIGFLVAGISLYDGVVLLILGAYWVALIAGLCFVATLYLQKYIQGT
jgi:4-hydroxybenzoate polyprenyltransferase